MRIARAAAAAVALLALLAAPALAGSRPSAPELETELVCPVCRQTLDQSSAPVAIEMKALIRKRIAQGWTKQQILDEMVRNFGPGVLSTPSKRGFDALAWALPIGSAMIGLGAVAYGANRWTRARPQTAEPALDPEMERRIDDELERFE